MKQLILDGSKIKLDEIADFLNTKTSVSIADNVIKNLSQVRNFVDTKIKTNNAYYGINTGFGKLANKRIADHELNKLQENIILSHAVGVGEAFSINTARLIMLLRAHVLAKGFSGVRAETLQLLVNMINHKVTPVIPCQGSVGASGDLAPLAHIGLAMIGKGEAYFKTKKLTASQALQQAELKAINLAAKEGLALVNGTQAITAVGAQALIKAIKLLKTADVIGAVSLEGDRASLAPFDERIHQARPHPGQLASAENVRRLTANSQIMAGHANCTRVQDPYSFRCIPQVHGAARDAIRYAKSVFEIELASCTDNPLLFPEDDAIISGGNFHGEPLAIALDTMAIAMAELGSISERRVAILVAPLDNELPASFLVPNSGLNSGMMIPHVTMSALVAENKVLAHPASTDSIPTSGGQEDHVSMGMHGARKALQIAENLEKILGIELMAACQAIDIQSQQEKPGKGTSAVYNLLREQVASIDSDREFQIDIAKSIEMVVSGKVLNAAENSIGKLAGLSL